jgi:anti-sigma-K factor RskA
MAEIREALEFWYVFAALTQRTQDLAYSDPTPLLRERVIGIGRAAGMRRTLGRTIVQTRVQTWMRMAAGLVLTAGAGTLSWNIGQSRIKQEVAAAQVRIEQQNGVVVKLESENNSLRNLVLAARNAPAVFPGKDSIVSVKDPYLVRDLQQARQTEVAIAAALNEERTKAADLERKLTQTTTMLASATHDREEADRRYRKAYDAASIEKERGANQLSTEIAVYNTRLQDLESQVGRYRTVIDTQNKKIEQHLQMISLLQSKSLAMVQLRAPAGQAVSGVAIIADDSRLAFFPTSLPTAPAGRTYQLWLIREKGPAVVSAGTFTGGAKDTPTLQFASKQLMAGIKSLAVTEEPVGGSPLPTGHRLMTGATPKN